MGSSSKLLGSNTLRETDDRNITPISLNSAMEPTQPNVNNLRSPCLEISMPMEYHKVVPPPPRSTFEKLKNRFKETFFPDDPLRQFKGQSQKRKWILGAQYIFPMLQWGATYSLKLFKSDIVAGLTIASLAIPQVSPKTNQPSSTSTLWFNCYNQMNIHVGLYTHLDIYTFSFQGISYAKLANLPPIIGLCKSFVLNFLITSSARPFKTMVPLIILYALYDCVPADSSFVPPLVYALLGSSRDLAVGPVSIASLLLGSMLRQEVSPTKEPLLFVQLAFTSTFFAGVFQASLGILR